MKLPAPFQGRKSIKALIASAEDRANALGDASVGAEHLVLAALDAPDGSARRVFARVGADPGAFGAAVEASHDAALRHLGLQPVQPELLGAVSRGPQRLSESAAHVLRSAATSSRADRPRTLGASVVAAAAELEHGTTARALHVLDIDRAVLAAAAQAEIQHPASPRSPR